MRFIDVGARREEVVDVEVLVVVEEVVVDVAVVVEVVVGKLKAKE